LLSDSAGVFVFAVLAGYLLQRTESLWPGVAAHVANNFAASYL
jgi:membrane protease YdiL (CAAX protease family)